MYITHELKAENNERNNNMNRDGMLTVARKLREVLTECEVTKQEAESIAYILLTDIKNSNKAAQKTYMENTKLQSVTDINQEIKFSKLIKEKVESGELSVNTAREMHGLKPIKEEFVDIFFTVGKRKQGDNEKIF